MTQSEYIKAEMLRYFPDAAEITVIDDDPDLPETIGVHIMRPSGKPDHFNLASYVCEIGSDDDCYVFEAVGTQAVLTVPLMPES